jgi:hypothetical protein
MECGSPCEFFVYGKEKKHGKLDEQYHRLWDYCSMVKSTNVASCLILMVERLMSQVPC